MTPNVPVLTGMNPGFVKLGELLGKERLFEYIEKFGFGEKTGIDLNGEGTGIVFPLEKEKRVMYNSPVVCLGMKW